MKKINELPDEIKSNIFNYLSFEIILLFNGINSNIIKQRLLFK